MKALRAYRKEWDDERGTWRDKPRHDWASHGADAFRVLATRYRYIQPPAPKVVRGNTVLVADQWGRVHYEDGTGPLSTRAVVLEHCRKRELERLWDTF